MAKDKIKINNEIGSGKLKSTNFGFISEKEYKDYKKIRRKRARINALIRENYRDSLNQTYVNSLYSLRKLEKEGRRFTIKDFKTRYDFDRFMLSAEKYLDYENYKKRKANEYAYNLREALSQLVGGDESILSRFDDIMLDLKDPYLLNDIFANNEELDISYVYVETMEQGIARIETFLDVLEAKIKEANRKE